MTPNDLQLLLSDVEIAQRQLTGIAARLRNMLRQQGSAAPANQRTERPPSSPAAKERTPPDDTKLSKLACPRCKSAMVWRWSRQNSEWFAGCTKFGNGCRGSRPYDNVMGVNRASPPRNPWKTEHFGDALPEAPPPPESEVTPELPEPEMLPYTLEE